MVIYRFFSVVGDGLVHLASSQNEDAVRNRFGHTIVGVSLFGKIELDFKTRAETQWMVETRALVDGRMTAVDRRLLRSEKEAEEHRRYMARSLPGTLFAFGHALIVVTPPSAAASAPVNLVRQPRIKRILRGQR